MEKYTKEGLPVLTPQRVDAWVPDILSMISNKENLEKKMMSIGKENPGVEMFIDSVAIAYDSFTPDKKEMLVKVSLVLLYDLLSSQAESYKLDAHFKK